MAIDLAQHLLGALPELRFHPTTKRVRALVGATVVVDSTRAWVVWEPTRVVPSYAVPRADVFAELVATAEVPATEHITRLGDGTRVLDPRTGFTAHTTPGRSYDIVTPEATLRRAAFTPDDATFDGYVVADFDAFDEWREEDDVLVGHARDPFTTVDTRHSSRRVVVAVDGMTLADSTRSIMLFETHLPTRFYLSRDDVRMDLLARSATTTVCAYKGQATYWSATIRDTVLPDVAWSYPHPHNYATAVEDLICFFNERVDISVDGQRLERPRSPWS